MTQAELYELVCNTFYGPSTRLRSESDVIARLLEEGVIEEGQTDFASLCVEGNPLYGLGDPASLALSYWIDGREPPPDEE